MTASSFQTLFLIALGLSFGLQCWLKLRHIRHVRANRSAVPPEFAAVIDLAAHQKAADYTIARSRFALIGLVAQTLILLGWTVGGGLNGLLSLVQSWLGNGLAAGVLLMALFTLVGSIIELPLSIYQTFRLEARFGFNQTTVATFVGDMVKGAILGAVLGLPLVTLVLWLMNQAGSGWWLYAWAAWASFSLLMLAVYPKFIAPLFNQFQPLEDATLKTRIDNLLTRCGFESNGVFVMDGSKRSSHGNAYFTGFGKTKRIVFFDTLLSHLEPVEVEAVLAHELGHFHHRHVLKRIVWMFGLALLALWVLGLLMTETWFFAGLGVTQVNTAAALLLFSMALPVFTFLFAPLMSMMSRRHEYEADRFAAKQSDAAALISGLVKLYRDNASTLTPDPLHSLFHDSHPPASLRIAALKAPQVAA